MALANGNIAFGVITPIAYFATFHIFEEIGFGRSEVKHPGVGGVKVVRFFEVEFLDKGGSQRGGGFKADKEGVLLLGEFGEGKEGIFKAGLISKGWSVRTKEIIAKWGRFEDGHSGKTIAFKAESVVIFEMFVSLPGG